MIARLRRNAGAAAMSIVAASSDADLAVGFAGVALLGHAGSA